MIDNEEVVESGYMLSPGGHKYYIPCCVEDTIKPFVNKSFESLENGIAFYKEYGRLCGFGVRRSAKKTHSDGTIVNKYLVCSRSVGYEGDINQGQLQS